MENHFRNLILSYDKAADERDVGDAAAWKQDLRQKFLELFEAEGKSSLIDIGAGTGHHAKFFQEQGLDVTCVDLSPAHVKKCREKGLKSMVLNILDLDQIDLVFDGAFALNSLLHIPTIFIQDVLSKIAGILPAGGLFFWGQHGGKSQEGVYQDDHHNPKRFFSLLSDDQILELSSERFALEEFEKIIVDKASTLYFQSLLLRVKS